MTHEFQSAGEFSVNTQERTVRGLLLPWNELSRTSASDTPPIKFKRGTLQVPGDVSVIGANRLHDRFDTVGRATSIEDTEQGLVAEFSIARTEEGDEFLAQHKAGTLRKLSAEMKNIVRNGSEAISARLTGAAFVGEGAFSSAALFALGDIREDEEPVEDPEGEDPNKPAETVDKQVSTFTDEDGVEHKKTTTTKTKTEPGKTTITTTEVIEEPDTAIEPTTEKEPTVANPIPGAEFAAGSTKKVDKNAFFGLVSKAVRDRDQTALMALADVKISGTAALGTGVVQPEWLGQIWSGKTFVRKVIPLLNSAALTSLTTRGYRFVNKPTVSEYAGNKAEIPTSTATTETVEWGLTKFAGGWDIAREFVDFGEMAVIEAFLTLAASDYAKKSDAKVLTDILAAATKGLVGTVPANTTPAMAKIVRGALRVQNADATPSFALLAPDVYEDILFTKQLDQLAFLNMSLGLDPQEGGALENFRILPHNGLAAGSVLVGAKEAVTVAEYAGSPIRVSALDIVRGGVDEALHGYVQTRIEYPAGLQLVTTA
jgi:hypothetical protein